MAAWRSWCPIDSRYNKQLQIHIAWAGCVDMSNKNKRGGGLSAAAAKRAKGTKPSKTAVSAADVAFAAVASDSRPVRGPNGGVRPGAGRPRLPGGPTTTMRIPVAVADVLRGKLATVNAAGQIVISPMPDRVE